MALKKYIVTINGQNNKLVLGYRKGLLVFLEISETARIEKLSQLKWLYDWLPLIEGDLTAVRSEKIKWEAIPDNLSFDRFWDEYSYKVGDKATAKREWMKLTPDKRAQVLNAIKKYRYWLANTGTRQLYPERFLIQRRWENEFKL